MLAYTDAPEKQVENELIIDICNHNGNSVAATCMDKLERNIIHKREDDSQLWVHTFPAMDSTMHFNLNGKCQKLEF